MTNEDMSLLTKQRLADALKTAMHSKPFSRVTVKEIVDTCGINRKTFYYHFEDIYALLKWTLEADGVEVVRKMNSMGNFAKSIEYVMDYVEKNQYLINCAYDSIGQLGLKRFFYNDFISMAGGIVEKAEKNSGHSLEPEYKDFLIRFYAEGIAGILLDWVTEENFPDRKTTAKYIMRIIQITEQSIGVV